jgi:hypothetical protein
LLARAKVVNEKSFHRPLRSLARRDPTGGQNVAFLHKIAWNFSTETTIVHSPFGAGNTLVHTAGTVPTQDHQVRDRQKEPYSDKGTLPACLDRSNFDCESEEGNQNGDRKQGRTYHRRRRRRRWNHHRHRRCPGGRSTRGERRVRSSPSYVLCFLGCCCCCGSLLAAR